MMRYYTYLNVKYGYVNNHALEDNENKHNEREAKTKATHESNYVEAINDMQNLQQEDHLVGDDIDQMRHESMDEG